MNANKIDRIKNLIKLVEESGITGLSVEEDGFKVSINKEVAANVVQHHTLPPASTNPAKTESAPPQSIQDSPDTLKINSPMVGTFYRAPSPDTASYVEVGTAVSAGKVVCIIEAMKLFNEIESDVSGEIIDILVENGQPVEYGQPLFLVKKK